MPLKISSMGDRASGLSDSGYVTSHYYYYYHYAAPFNKEAIYWFNKYNWKS